MNNTSSTLTLIEWSISTTFHRERWIVTMMDAEWLAEASERNQ